MKELKDMVAVSTSRASTDAIVHWVGDDQQRFDELFALFTGKENRIVMRAAWPVSYVIENHPQLINKHFPALLKKLSETDLHDSIKRNTMRLLQEIIIPEKFQGRIMDTCFRYITNPAEKPAIKAFALTVLANLAKQYPEINQELKTIIQSQWDNESPSFKARARMILKKI